MVVVLELTHQLGQLTNKKCINKSDGVIKNKTHHFYFFDNITKNIIYMKTEEIKEILNKVSFAPSNLDMGWDWDIKSTKIYDDTGVVLEKGYSIRTTFMRPDVNTGEIERGYGRWMYVPENVSQDGVVKTAWVCADLVVKHELMEAFLFNNVRIFDPHKSLNDLQYNGRVVNVNSNTENIEETQTIDVVKFASKIASKDVREPKHIRDDSVSNVESISSEKIFHKQNLGNHIQEITEYLNDNLTKKDNRVDSNMKSSIDKYIILTNTIFHNYEEGMIRLVDSNGKIVDYRSDEKYTLSEVKDMLDDMITRSFIADSAVINQEIYSAGFTVGKPKEDFWVFSNPNIKHRYVVHSEIDKSFAIINQNGDIVSDSSGTMMVYENERYSVTNLKKVLSSIN